MAVTISRIRTCQRYKVLLPHFQLDWTAKYLKFCSRTSILSSLLKIWGSASALPHCGDCQRSEVTLLHCIDYQWCEVRYSISALPWLPMMWYELSSALLLCQFFRRCEVPLLHFRPALTAKDMKFSFRTSALRLHTSALPWLAKMWNSAFQTSVLPGLRKISSSTSALFRPGLPKMWRSTSAFHLCRDFQRCEVPPPHFCSALTVKDLKFPLTLCFNCQKCEIPLPHFRSAMTAK